MTVRERALERLGTTSITIVTSNEGKFREFQAVLAPLGLDPRQRPIPYPELQTDRLEDVVAFALRWIAERERLSTEVLLIEDSGLFVDALKGFPGVYSAHALHTIGCEGLLRLLDGVPRPLRHAHFAAVIGLIIPAPAEGGYRTEMFRGECPGRIADAASGHGGFGFDPIFVPEGDRRTFAELPMEAKNLLSHRGRATAKLVQWLTG